MNFESNVCSLQELTYFNGWLLLLKTFWTYPVSLTLFHFLAHLPRNSNTFAMEPIFAFVTTDHEAIIVWLTTYTPKSEIEQQ